MLNSLAPLIGAEADLGDRAVSAGWAEGVSEEQIAEWRQRGVTLVKEEMEILIQEVTSQEYGRLMRRVSLQWRRPLLPVHHSTPSPASCPPLRR